MAQEQPSFRTLGSGQTIVYTQPGRGLLTTSKRGQEFLKQFGLKAEDVQGRNTAEFGAPESATFINKQTGDKVIAPKSSPLASNQNFTAGTKAGEERTGLANQFGGVSLADPGSQAAGQTTRNLGNGFGTLQDIARPVDPRVGTNLAGFGSTFGLAGAGAGVTGAGAADTTGQQAGSAVDLGQLDFGSMFQGSTQLGGFNLPGFGAEDGGTGLPTAEQLAAGQLGVSLDAGQAREQNALQDFLQTAELATQQTQEGLGLIQQQAEIGAGQAERQLGLGVESLDVQRAQADLQYNQAVSQISTNRERENEFLKQKLASAGATDSTAGVEILSRSAQKYDEIFGNLAGQRQVALAQFSIAESEVRNRYTTAVENITVSANQLATQLNQALQQTLTSGAQALGDVRVGEGINQQQAIQDYFEALTQIDAAKKEAEADAAQAALDLQQQAFDNAVKLGNLTGTYTDPITGEEVRTLAGEKFDASQLQSSVGGGKGVGDLSDEEAESTLISALNQALQFGIIDLATQEKIMSDVSTSQSGIGTRAKEYIALLNDRISRVQGAAGLSQGQLAERATLIPQETRDRQAYEADLGADIGSGRRGLTNAEITALAAKYPQYIDEISKLDAKAL